MGYLLTCFSYRKVSHSVVNGLVCRNKSAKMAKNRDFGGYPPVGRFLAHFGPKMSIFGQKLEKKIEKNIFLSEKHFTMFL